MVRPIIAIAAAVALGGAAPAHAAQSAKDMYESALVREGAVRATFADAQQSAGALDEVRSVVTAYRALVRRYPASGYSDNALWQAGVLSIDAFTRFGDEQDRETGIRLLQQLATGYPSSSLAKRASDELAALRAPEPRARAESVTVSGQAATIKDIRRIVLPDAVRVTIELDAEVSFHEERIPNPDRVFVDLSPTRPALALIDQTLRFTSDSDVVRQVRVGRHPNKTTRVVLDAAGVSSYSVYPLYNPYRLVIDCIRADMLEGSVPTLIARRIGGEWAHKLPRVAPQRGRIIRDAADAAVVSAAPHVRPPASAATAEARSPRTAQPAGDFVRLVAPSAVDVGEDTADAQTRRVEAASQPSPPAIPPAHNVSGGFSIARQLGLGVSRVVIDPGHGGHDPGASARGVTEADLVLDVALRLEKLLQKVPGVEVVLTRRTDEFVPLQERTAIANRENADLFLSIHANASENPHARGVETYFLNFANNLTAAAVAARENAASGQAMGALPDFVKAIALNNKLDESRDFATYVQRSMVDRLRGSNKSLKDLGVKQAPFVVLIGAAMPSVLAEISFVTNAQDARLLKGGPYRQRIAESLLAAVRNYQASLQRVPAVAHQ